jgi:hypothetical protein
MSTDKNYVKPAYYLVDEFWQWVEDTVDPILDPADHSDYYASLIDQFFAENDIPETMKSEFMTEWRK